MTDCATRFEELTHEGGVVRDEDLAALQRMTDRTRIDRYNTIKANEEEFLFEFSEECPEFLTDAERARVRGNFRLARLLIAASFYGDDGDVPRAMDDDFVEAELQAVVDFDRYRQFDALSESQIEEKIRRMEGEVYELVEEYTSTQIANLDELLEHPDIQQDVMERLLDRYETRREKIRQGFFVYVETHGLEHMVAAIEEAVEAVNEASTERQAVRQDLQAELAELSEAVNEDSLSERRRLDSEIDRLESELAGSGDVRELREQVEHLTDQVAAISDSQTSAVTEMDAQIERTTELDHRIEVQIENLQSARKEAVSEARAEASEEAAELVEDELEQLRGQRAEIQRKLDQLEREREKVAATRESLDERRQQLESRVSHIEQSVGTNQDGVEGENVVTAQMAKVLEMDYLGRFDISMHEASSVHTGDGEFAVPDGYWEQRSQRRSNYSYLVDLLDTDVEDPNQYPANETARYEITSSGYLGLGSRTEMVIEARVISNLYAHATNGFDAQPADLDAFLAIVNEVVAEAEEGGYEFLLVLASPTGWSERVRDEILGDDIAKSRYSQYVSVCLIDLQDGSLTYDESDPVVRENADLFVPPISEEQVQNCVDLIRTEYVDDIARESVLLRDVVSEHGYDSEIVKRAFNRLEGRGEGEQLYLDELGLSLSVG
jgi:hypothetical protein